MYVSNGIAYAGEKAPDIKVCGVRPMKDHKLWIRFTTGEAKVFDFKPMLKFAGVYIDYGVTVWEDGDIDIAPEYLYNHSVSANEIA
mgnify:CR=1 FL=1